jgi:hypothetical protein
MIEDRHKDSERCPKSCGEMDVPSEDEISALQAMRRIKERVRDVRTRLSAISSGTVAEEPGEKETLEHEIGGLKSEWETWEQKRKKAAHERMLLLGHEEPFLSE